MRIIILKILLWIILAILGLILLVLILPVSAEMSYIDGKLSYKIRYSFLSMLDSDGKGIADKLKGRKKKKASESETFGENEDITEDITSADENISEETLSESENADTESEKEPVFYGSKETDSVSKKTDRKKSRKKAEKNSSESETAGKKSRADKLEFFLNIWEIADRPVLKIFKGIKLSELYIDFIIADEDAYKCALNYGKISGAVYTLLAWFSVLFNVRLKTVDINPGFALEKSQWDVSLRVSLNLMTPIIAGLWFLIIYFFKVVIPSRKKNKSEVR